MKNDNTQTNHRGSSPPFQDPEQDFYKWLNGLKTIGQRDEKAPEIQKTDRSEDKKTKSTDLKDDSCWQDDGGEGG